MNPVGIFKAVTVVWSGRRFGNQVADHLCVNRRLFHSALELGGLSQHLILLGLASRANQPVGDTAALVSGYLIDGLGDMRVAFGEQQLILSAIKNVQMFRGEVEGFDQVELMQSVPFNRGLAYRATR
jgi:hypothetical protein